MQAARAESGLTKDKDGGCRFFFDIFSMTVQFPYISVDLVTYDDTVIARMLTQHNISTVSTASKIYQHGCATLH